MSEYVITIGRQYGSGGRSVGKYLAEKLGVKYYDSELIRLAAEKNEVDSEFYKEADEKASKLFNGFFSFATPTGYYLPIYNDMIVNDALFMTQASIIREAAAQSCVIVGRCSEYILREHPNLVRVFLYADKEDRKKRLVEKYGESEKNVEKVIAKSDRQRSVYYNTYTDGGWGEMGNYDICINTSKLSIEGAAETVLDYIKHIGDKGAKE